MSISHQAALAARDETDRDILYYVREMQSAAPVTAESVHSFLTRHRRRELTLRQTQDRLDYLVSAKYLEEKTEWSGGEMRSYRITADGMDFMDKAIPPRNWK